MNETGKPEYASFWRRLGAYVIDSLIVGPLDKLMVFAGCYILSPIGLMFALVIKGIAFFLYRPVCHANWGRTIGKRCLRLRVTQCDSKSLSFPRALVRELFFVPSILFGMIAVVLVLRHSPEIGSYSGFTNVMGPFYHGRASLPFQIVLVYTWAITVLQASFVVLHPQHRALHDLVAKTIVVHESKPQKEFGMPLEDISCLQCGIIVPKEKHACPACGWTYQKEE